MKMCACVIHNLCSQFTDTQCVQVSVCKSMRTCGWGLLLVNVCAYFEGTCLCSCAKNLKVCTYHEEHAEVGQFSEEFFHTDRVGVKGKKTAYIFIQLLHVLVHGGQFFILLPGTLAEAVRSRESRKKGERHVSNIHKAYSKIISNIISHLTSVLISRKTSHCEK